MAQRDELQNVCRQWFDSNVHLKINDVICTQSGIHIELLPPAETVDDAAAALSGDVSVYGTRIGVRAFLCGAFGIEEARI